MYPQGASLVAICFGIVKEFRIAEFEELVADGIKTELAGREFMSRLSIVPLSVLSNLPNSARADLTNSNLAKFPPITNSIGMQLKLIPAGTFLMGNDTESHQVTLSDPFLIGVHEVTQEQYERVMGLNRSHFNGSRNPVEWVSWSEAYDFCQRLSNLPEESALQRMYRLPTESEWEYACRAGTTTAYGFGDNDSELGRYAWYLSNSGGQTQYVGQKQANAWGLYDMHGNVFEWCMDSYGDYPSNNVTDPVGPSLGLERVIRGGSWNGRADNCYSGVRGSYSAANRDNRIGFRVVCVPNPFGSP